MTQQETRGTTRLTQDTLDAVAATVPVPAYDRSGLGGIVHLGVGGFHRAHEAMYVDLLAADGGDWGITGVGVLPGDRRMHEVMQEQDSLYTLVVKHSDGSTDPRVIGSLVGYLFAPDDPEAVLALMTDPATRIVSLTVTEGGYHVNQATGDFDASDDDLQADLVEGATPRTAFGLLTEALARRRAAPRLRSDMSKPRIERSRNERNPALRSADARNQSKRRCPLPQPCCSFLPINTPF